MNEHLINTITWFFILYFESKVSNKKTLQTEEPLLTPDHNYNKNEANGKNTKKHEQGSAADACQSDKNATTPADVEQILDLIKWDAKSEVKCLVKYKGITKPQWMPVDEIKRTNPIPLIDYYETRIVLRKKQYEMVFERTATSSAQRKLIVIQ